MNLATLLEGHPATAPALISRGNTTTYGEVRDDEFNGVATQECYPVATIDTHGSERTTNAGDLVAKFTVRCGVSSTDEGRRSRGMTLQQRCKIHRCYSSP